MIRSEEGGAIRSSGGIVMVREQRREGGRKSAERVIPATDRPTVDTDSISQLINRAKNPSTSLSTLALVGWVL